MVSGHQRDGIFLLSKFSKKTFFKFEIVKNVTDNLFICLDGWYFYSTKALKSWFPFVKIEEKEKTTNCNLNTFTALLRNEIIFSSTALAFHCAVAIKYPGPIFENLLGN